MDTRIDPTGVPPTADMTSPPVPWIETDPYGRIEDISAEAARLIGLSARGACSRDVRLFFPASFSALSRFLRLGDNETISGIHDLYPRDRKRVRVLLHVQASPEGASGKSLRWTLERV
jgi:hypothetical protein